MSGRDEKTKAWIEESCEYWKAGNNQYIDDGFDARLMRQELSDFSEALTAAAKRVEGLEGENIVLNSDINESRKIIDELNGTIQFLKDEISRSTYQLAALKAVAEQASEALYYAKMFGSQGDVEFGDNPEHLGKSVSYFVSKSLDDLCSTLATTNGEGDL